MNLIAFLGVCVCWMVGIATYANEIDYRNCESIQDIIAIETQEIADTNPKACVAPITRKWREWKNNKERHAFPNAQNLPLYIS